MGSVVDYIFLEAFRLRSPPHALVAFGALAFALGARMGSLLTLPFLAFWVAFAFLPKSCGARARLFMSACGVGIAVIVTNTLLGFLYGPPGVVTGGNFAYRFADWPMVQPGTAAT